MSKKDKCPTNRLKLAHPDNKTLLHIKGNEQQHGSLMKEKQKFEAVYSYIASLRPAAWAIQDPVRGNRQKSSKLDLVDRSKKTKLGD